MKFPISVEPLFKNFRVAEHWFSFICPFRSEGGCESVVLDRDENLCEVGLLIPLRYYMLTSKSATKGLSDNHYNIKMLIFLYCPPNRIAYLC